MQIVIDISKGRYDEIMSMDWNNCRLLFVALYVAGDRKRVLNILLKVVSFIYQKLDKKGGDSVVNGG